MKLSGSWGVGRTSTARRRASSSSVPRYDSRILAFISVSASIPNAASSAVPSMTPEMTTAGGRADFFCLRYWFSLPDEVDDTRLAILSMVERCELEFEDEDLETTSAVSARESVCSATPCSARRERYARTSSMVLTSFQADVSS
ncbi:hypothetical protein F444_16774 [Phytophthora nicotianae P1976]|uniref:Uncharacterized protein n=1 Tax=Phytophthora nicotianae P1976 TaxID=1317066 RepID=A0A080ZH66_PHYNI|nr:hypothetical protein F444_16774 [Phytophthora nicotianae P1976]